MSKEFCISVSCDVHMTVEEIWPDGDAPANPTAVDVIKEFKRTSKTKNQFLEENNLTNDLDICVDTLRVSFGA